MSGTCSRVLAAEDQAAYFTTGTVLHVHGMKDSTHLKNSPKPNREPVLHRGDVLEMTRDCCAPAPLATESYPRISYTLPTEEITPTR